MSNQTANPLLAGEWSPMPSPPRCPSPATNPVLETSHQQHPTYCHIPRGFNTEIAMRKAKENVEKHYAVVGVLEELNKTLTVLEHYVPRFFKGAKDVYWSKCTWRSHHDLPHRHCFRRDPDLLAD